MAGALDAAACSGGAGGAPASSCGAGPAALEIWSGLDEDNFAPLAAGDLVYLRCGGQGLRHVRIRIRAVGVAPRFHVESVIRSVDGVDLIAQAPRHTPEMTFREVAGSCESPDQLLIVGPASSALEGRTATIEVHLADALGVEVTGSQQVVLDTQHMRCE